MRTLVAVAELTGSRRLIDISRAHLVGAYHAGTANLELVEKLAAEGLRVAVPTTLNAGSFDLHCPRAADRDHPDFEASHRLLQLLGELGCESSLTCAPYHLPDPPATGECVAWSESNAVAYANSVLGARSNRTCQYLDLSAALTGRMPDYGLYRTENRRADCLFTVRGIPARWLADTGFHALLGLQVGALAGDGVPLIDGLPPAIDADHLRALGAAAASSGQVALFHVTGSTPEAPDRDTALHARDPRVRYTLGPEAIRAARARLSQGPAERLGAVCLGTPHASRAECEALLQHLDGRRVRRGVAFTVSTSRHVAAALERSGVTDALAAAGVRLVTDRCSYYRPRCFSGAGLVLTNSAKWAYYAPGNLDLAVRFATTRECVESAVAGRLRLDEGFWRA